MVCVANPIYFIIRLCGYPPFRAKDDNTLYELIKKGVVDFTTDEVWNKVSEEGLLLTFAF